MVLLHVMMGQYINTKIDQDKFNEAAYMAAFDDLDKNGYNQYNLEGFKQNCRNIGVIMEVL